MLDFTRSCGVNTVSGCGSVPGLSPWSVERHLRRCVLTGGPLEETDSGAWECHLTQYGVTESTISLTRQDLITAPLTLSPAGASLTVEEGEEVSWSCQTSATVTTEPRASWTVGASSYPGNTSTTFNTQSNGVKVGAPSNTQRNIWIFGI